MSQKPTEENQIPPFYLRIGLLVVLVASGSLIFYSANWMYHRIRDRLGLEIAEVVIAFLMILIVILILFGFGVGVGMDQIVRRRKIQALWICRSLMRFRIINSLLRYIRPNQILESGKLDSMVPLSIPAHPPRRGRRPTHSLERWARVVQAWESRDTLRNTLTLSEFLAEEFGVYADGSPQMSENSYYEWRKRVLQEIRRQKPLKKDKAAIR